MPASQTGFGGFMLERSVGMAAGFHIPMLGCPPALQQQQQQHQQHHQQQQQHQQAQHLAAMAAGLPLTYPGLQGYNFLPYAHTRAVTHMSTGFDMKAASSYHHALLASRGGPFYPQYRPGPAEDPGRVAKVATRESTGALKAWLSEHLKNPYPTKGEKIMLAIITKMSLTQVSTWFANARRRLKKENRVSWASKGKSDEEDEEQEVESDEEEEGAGPNCGLEEEEEEEERSRGEGGAAGPAGVAVRGPARLEMPEEEEEVREEEEKVARKSDSDVMRSDSDSKDNGGTQKPKIWSLAETATSETDRKPVDSGFLWAEWAARHGLFIPAYVTRDVL